VTGTQDGDVRRYDTRAARRPVANWKGLAKSGSVRRVEKGLSEQYVNSMLCELMLGSSTL
jgi:ribosome biogenesis protein NSA1